jgi:excisionase family DNA binding protein
MEQLLTVEQYAQRTHLHPDSVRRKLREGRLRAIKKGRVWRIPENVVYEDSRRDLNRWKQAAEAMRSVYADALRHNEELTAITNGPGGFHALEKDGSR